ncbi:MAG: hypothetical protein COA84_11440 [Robiginitomaculum sp.]|nr:MAG: hypothetical protein COA84_11440 [Robiginitomaculum sp.]
MTVLEQVEYLIAQRSPKPLCDDCIAKLLKITPRQHANHKTRILAKKPAFDRRGDVCSSCGNTKLVIKKT